MSDKSSRKTFINLAVKDLPRSIEFFGKLGFSFNQQFTNADGACMVITEEAYAMLLTEPFFKGFTRREICNTATHTEALIALSCDSRAEVERLMTTALEAGATRAMEPKDHGFMYVVSFYDLDGHHWELFWMDPKGPTQ